MRPPTTSETIIFGRQGARGGDESAVRRAYEKERTGPIIYYTPGSYEQQRHEYWTRWEEEDHRRRQEAERRQRERDEEREHALRRAKAVKEHELREKKRVARNGCLTIAGYVLALAMWNGYTNNPVKFNSTGINNRTAASAEWAGGLEAKLKSAPKVPALPEIIETKYGPVKTKDIPFEGEFTIHTERYSLIKEEDSWLEQAIGQVGSIQQKIFFWDNRVGSGTDSRGAKRVLAMLEDDKSIDGITVRLNHNRALYDLYRTFSEPALTERNNFVARFVIGVPVAIKDELWAGLFRGAYYNPMSRTAVSYADIDAITFHEVGHGKDFSRFDRDWIYSLSRMIPPVMLYQEAKASAYAKEMLAPEENFQFYRFLIPAFATYLLATYGATKRFVKRRILGIKDEQAGQ